MIQLRKSEIHAFYKLIIRTPDIKCSSGRPGHPTQPHCQLSIPSLNKTLLK